jgi:hypothetical protein
MTTQQVPPSTPSTPPPLPEQVPPISATAGPVPFEASTTQLTLAFPRSGAQDAQLEALFTRASEYFRTLGPPA